MEEGKTERAAMQSSSWGRKTEGSTSGVLRSLQKRQGQASEFRFKTKGVIKNVQCCGELSNTEIGRYAVCRPVVSLARAA